MKKATEIGKFQELALRVGQVEKPQETTKTSLQAKALNRPGELFVGNQDEYTLER